MQIGDQVWMAENIKWAPSITKLYEQRIDTVNHIYCYDDDPTNCEKYGMLYAWPIAQKACPEGWHLPSREEYEILIHLVGEGNQRIAYNTLLMGGASGFEGGLFGYITSVNGAHYISVDRIGAFWTSEDLHNDKSEVTSFILNRPRHKAQFSKFIKIRNSAYVRCLKN